MSAKHPTLFDVPKDSPSLRDRINAFKEQHGILTHHAPHMVREDGPWLALIPFKEDEGRDIGAIMADSCRLYDESGQCATGTGELSTIRQLCSNLKIQCTI